MGEAFSYNLTIRCEHFLAVDQVALERVEPVVLRQFQHSQAEMVVIQVSMELRERLVETAVVEEVVREVLVVRVEQVW